MKTSEFKLQTIVVMVSAMHRFVSNLNERGGADDQLTIGGIKAAQESLFELKRIAEKLGLENRKYELKRAA